MPDSVALKLEVNCYLLRIYAQAQLAYDYTANVFRDLHGLYREIGAQDFKFTGIACIPVIHVIFEVDTLCGLLIRYFFQNSL